MCHLDIVYSSCARHCYGSRPCRLPLSGLFLLATFWPAQRSDIVAVASLHLYDELVFLIKVPVLRLQALELRLEVTMLVLEVLLLVQLRLQAQMRLPQLALQPLAPLTTCVLCAFVIASITV